MQRRSRRQNVKDKIFYLLGGLWLVACGVALGLIFGYGIINTY